MIDDEDAICSGALLLDFAQDATVLQREANEMKRRLVMWVQHIVVYLRVIYIGIILGSVSWWGIAREREREGKERMSMQPKLLSTASEW